jgi:multidrug resistance efflux pump
MKPNRRLLSWIVVPSLATLAILSLGACWLIGLPAAGSGANSSTVASQPAAAPGVVCFGYVDLEHGCASLYPLQPGRVAEVLVRANDKVEAGAPLLKLEDGAARARVEEARAALQAAQAQLEQARSAPEQQRIRLSMQKAAIQAVTNRLAAARQLLQRKQELAQQKLTDFREVAAAEDQIKEVESLRDVEAKKLVELQLHNPALEVRQAEAQVALMEARLHQAEHALAECTLKAPQAGTVARVLATPGQVFAGQPGQAAIIFAADEPRIVRAELEQEFAGQVAPGQHVRVQDDTNSELTCRGKVALVSDWFMQRRAIFQEPTRFNDTRTIECIIALDPGHPPLRIGQRVRVLIGATAN